MSQELLDLHIPGWAALSTFEFRARLNEVDALLRRELRAARDEALATPPPAAIPPTDPPPRTRGRTRSPE